MIIIQMAGGLGNQMQQYALYRKLVSLGKEAKLDISWFEQADRQERVYAKRELELNYFENLKYQVCTEDEKKALAGNGSLAGKLKGKLFPGTKRFFRNRECIIRKFLILMINMYAGILHAKNITGILWTCCGMNLLSPIPARITGSWRNR